MNEALLFLEPVKGVVLDVGCGDGIPTTYLIQNHQVIGVDFASTMLLRAKASLRSIDLVTASIDHLPFPNSSIPAVTCFFVLSDYHNPSELATELCRVLQNHGRIVLADYSSHDDFNNILDELQVKVLGRGRGMFRPSPEAMAVMAEDSGLKVDTVKELTYPLTISLEAFVNQLYFSSVGPEYRAKQLGNDEWRKLLGERLRGSEIRLTRRFALVLGRRVYS